MRILLSCALAVLSVNGAWAQKRPLIAIAGIQHESNTFNPTPTRYEDFLQRKVSPAAEALAEWERNQDEIAGYIDGAKKYGFDVLPVFSAQAVPRGPVTEDALDRMTATIIDRMKKGPKVDGLLLALHGALVAEKHPEGDVEIMRRLRKALGKDLPIVVTHDFHANVAPEMAELTTALITYKQVPHIDQRDRGLKAAEIMAGVVSGKFRPTQAIVKPPMIYNIVFQYTKKEPLLPIVEETLRMEKQAPFLAVSVSGGYQYADVNWVGPSVIVVTNNDRGLAEREAKRLSDKLWATRDKLVLKLPDAAAAVRQASAGNAVPTVLVEMGDNIGGGSSGDATFILSELVKQRAQGWVVVIADPAAVNAAFQAGVGKAFDMAVGGKMDKLHGDPVSVKGVVKSLNDGKYLETEVRHGGHRYLDQGLTAVVEAGGSTRDMPNILMLTTGRQVPFSLHQLISCGVYPQRQKMLVVKAAIAYRAAYEPIAAKIIEVDTPGTTAVNPRRFTFKRARRPLFGLE